MQADQHARVLNAYLSRLTAAALDEIYATQRKSWNAAMNLGLSAQTEADKEAREAIINAMESMRFQDLNNITRIIDSACS